MQDDTKPLRGASRRASDVDLDALIWEQRGAVEVCKACGFVREGTASATLRHRERCIAVVLYGAALVLQRQGRDDSDFAGDMESLFEAGQAEIGRLHAQRTRLLGLIGDLVKLAPESAEAVFAMTDIIMSGGPATERRDA